MLNHISPQLMNLIMYKIAYFPASKISNGILFDSIQWQDTEFILCI